MIKALKDEKMRRLEVELQREFSKKEQMLMGDICDNETIGLYKFVDKNGKVIYIGKSVSSIENRILSHMFNAKWFSKYEISEVYIMQNLTEADIHWMEIYYINKEKPVGNQDAKSNNSILTADMVDESRFPKWELFHSFDLDNKYKEAKKRISLLIDKEIKEDLLRIKKQLEDDYLYKGNEYSYYEFESSELKTYIGKNIFVDPYTKYPFQSLEKWCEFYLVNPERLYEHLLCGGNMDELFLCKSTTTKYSKDYLNKVTTMFFSPVYPPNELKISKEWVLSKDYITFSEMCVICNIREDFANDLIDTYDLGYLLHYDCHVKLDNGLCDNNKIELYKKEHYMFVVSMKKLKKLFSFSN